MSCALQSDIPVIQSNNVYSDLQMAVNVMFVADTLSFAMHNAQIHSIFTFLVLV